MLDPTLIVLTGGGLVLGVGAAQIGGPMSWNWRPRVGAIHHRLNCLPRAAPSAPWRIAGAALVLSLLAGGTLAAYAAEPSAPSAADMSGASSPPSAPGVAGRLLTEAAGVVGSGDQLSLKLRTPGGDRVLKVGQAYVDGWTLHALTPTKATLTRDGLTVEIGLNPTGAIASSAPAAPPSTVSLIGLPDTATIQRYVDAALAKDPKAVDKARGASQVLTVEEGRRRIAFQGMVDDEISRRLADNPAAGKVLSPADQRALMGETAFNDYWDLDKRMSDLSKAQELADLAARPVTGPTSYYVPAGTDLLQAATDQGAQAQRGIWQAGAVDAQGGRTFTLVAGTADQVAAYRAKPQQGPVPPAAGTPLAFMRMPNGQQVNIVVPGP